MVSHRLGQVEYLNRRFKSREPIYLQDIHEMIQFFRLAMGEIPMPAEIGPFAFYKGLRFDKRMPRVLRDAERVVIEVCTDKHYHAMGYAMPSARTRSIGSLSKRRARPGGPGGWKSIVATNLGTTLCKASRRRFAVPGN